MSMRKLSKKEREELISTLSGQLQKDMVNMYKQGLLNGNWSPVSTAHASPLSVPTSSPTDVNAKGLFPYQEPECDEQGTYYGYKVLVRRPDANICGCEACQAFVSPRFPVQGMWLNGELEADEEPNEISMHGIHFTKRPDNFELVKWYHDIYWRDSVNLLVHCALSGTVVETEQGFRAQHAQVTEVMIDGHWESYSNYQERSRANSRRSSYKKIDWDFTGGNW